MRADAFPGLANVPVLHIVLPVGLYEGVYAVVGCDGEGETWDLPEESCQSQESPVVQIVATGDDEVLSFRWPVVQNKLFYTGL